MENHGKSTINGSFNGIVTYKQLVSTANVKLQEKLPKNPHDYLTITDTPHQVISRVSNEIRSG